VKSACPACRALRSIAGREKGDARILGTIGYLAIKELGYSGREVGSFLNMRSYSAIRRPARFA